jgi:serine phosphatase RsbU (regulator of sigma subunit)
MLDDIPVISPGSIHIENPSKIVLYTDGLSELKNESGEDIGTGPIIDHIRNNDSIEENINSLIRDLGIPDNNPSMFDDVSIIAARLQ